jgi:hypothetical protein
MAAIAGISLFMTFSPDGRNFRRERSHAFLRRGHLVVVLCNRTCLRA